MSLKVKQKLFSPLFFAIGIRYAFSSNNYRFASFIALLSMLGIMLGVAALIVVCSIMNGLEGVLKDKVFAATPHAIVTAYDTKNSTENNLSFIKDLPQVTSSSEVAIEEIIVQGKKEIAIGKILGMSPKTYPSYDILKSSIGIQTFNALERGSYEIFIGHSLAQQLDIQEGDKIRITVPSVIRYTALGKFPVSRVFTVAGIYSVGIADVEASLILGHIDDVKRLLNIKNNERLSIRVWLDDPFEIDDFISDVTSKNSSVNIEDWRVEKGEFFKSVQMEKIMISIMLSLIILVAAFNMLSALVMVVTGKISEIAILRTMGISRKQIMMIFVVEGALSGVIGSVLGVGLGFIIVNYVDPILSTLGLNLYVASGGSSSLPILIDYQQIFYIVLGTVLLSFLVTIYPSYRGAMLNPATSLRYE